MIGHLSGLLECVVFESCSPLSLLWNNCRQAHIKVLHLQSSVHVYRFTVSFAFIKPFFLMKYTVSFVIIHWKKWSDWSEGKRIGYYAMLSAMDIFIYDSSNQYKALWKRNQTEKQNKITIFVCYHVKFHFSRHNNLQICYFCFFGGQLMLLLRFN